jgi:hypothetical protein
MKRISPNQPENPQPYTRTPGEDFRDVFNEVKASYRRRP